MQKFLQNTFVKGLIMAIVTYLGTAVLQHPANAVIFWSVLIGTILAYIGKNYAFPSTSVIYQLGAQDYVSGLFMAIATAFMDIGASWATNAPITAHGLLTLVGTVTAGYLGKTFFSGKRA